MNHRGTLRRLAIAAATAGVLTCASVTAAQAATVPSTEPSTDRNTAAATQESRFVQGKNFCLLSTCHVGGGGEGDDRGGILGIQGLNFCLLSVCEVHG
ncbi:hypothetical protein [Streptomyces sedi]|uniref:Secreted protein n=1 Tax=Streptomyces sedi TaxID=555059 RepID=A0A5C4VES4_9ACTN|nr:hypothetical protein [Streptomyces sedi]TNM34403.1 hypothetical protein FH715_01605 [Streptomyces sedi]